MQSYSEEPAISCDFREKAYKFCRDIIYEQHENILCNEFNDSIQGVISFLERKSIKNFVPTAIYDCGMEPLDRMKAASICIRKFIEHWPNALTLNGSRCGSAVDAFNSLLDQSCALGCKRRPCSLPMDSLESTFSSLPGKSPLIIIIEDTEIFDSLVLESILTALCSDLNRCARLQLKFLFLLSTRGGFPPVYFRSSVTSVLIAREFSGPSTLSCLEALHTALIIHGQFPIQIGPQVFAWLLHSFHEGRSSLAIYVKQLCFIASQHFKRAGSFLTMNSCPKFIENCVQMNSSQFTDTIVELVDHAISRGALMRSNCGSNPEEHSTIDEITQLVNMQATHVLFLTCLQEVMSAIGGNFSATRISCIVGSYMIDRQNQEFSSMILSILRHYRTFPAEVLLLVLRRIKHYISTNESFGDRLVYFHGLCQSARTKIEERVLKLEQRIDTGRWALSNVNSNIAGAEIKSKVDENADYDGYEECKAFPLFNIDAVELREGLHYDFDQFIFLLVDIFDNSIGREEQILFLNNAATLSHGSLRQVLWFDDTKELERAFQCQPRRTISSALYSPGKFFHCKCCENSKMIGTMDDTSIAYHLLLQFGRSVDMLSWFVNFLDVIAENIDFKDNNIIINVPPMAKPSTKFYSKQSLAVPVKNLTKKVVTIPKEAPQKRYKGRIRSWESKDSECINSKIPFSLLFDFLVRQGWKYRKASGFDKYYVYYKPVGTESDSAQRALAGKEGVDFFYDEDGGFKMLKENEELNFLFAQYVRATTINANPENVLKLELKGARKRKQDDKIQPANSYHSNDWNRKTFSSKDLSWLRFVYAISVLELHGFIKRSKYTIHRLAFSFISEQSPEGNSKIEQADDFVPLEQDAFSAIPTGAQTYFNCQAGERTMNVEYAAKLVQPRGGKNKRKFVKRNRFVAVAKADRLFKEKSAAKKKKDSHDVHSVRLMPWPEANEIEAIAVHQNEMKHIKERDDIYRVNCNCFNRWYSYLSDGFGLLLHGYGSKRLLLNHFSESKLKSYGEVFQVHAYKSSTNIRAILRRVYKYFFSESREDICDRNIVEYAENINDAIGSLKTNKILFLVVHSIDAELLQSDGCQAALSIIASNPHISIVGSVNHINVGLLWDSKMSASFNWIWQDATTFEPYIEEIRGRVNFSKQKKLSSNSHLPASASNGMSALINVLQGLASCHTEVIKILAEMLLLEKSNSQSRISETDLTTKCLKNMIKSRQLQSVLRQLKDQGLINHVSSENASYITIPYSREILREIVKLDYSDIMNAHQGEHIMG